MSRDLARPCVTLRDILRELARPLVMLRDLARFCGTSCDFAKHARSYQTFQFSTILCNNSRRNSSDPSDSVSVRDALLVGFGFGIHKAQSDRLRGNSRNRRETLFCTTLRDIPKPARHYSRTPEYSGRYVEAVGAGCMWSRY